MLSYFLAGVTIGPVVSQTLLDLMMLFIFVCFAKEAVAQKFKTFPTLRKPYLFEYGFIFYVIAIVIGMLTLGISDLYSWSKLSNLIWIVNFYVFIWVFSRYEVNLVKIIKFFSWAFLLPNLYALISTLFNTDFIRGRELFQYRLVGLLGSSTYHAHANGLLLAFFFVILYFTYSRLSKTYKILSLLSVLLFSAGIFMTFTRGIWLSLGICAFAFLFIFNRKHLIVGLVGCTVIVSSLYSTSDTFQNRIKHTIETKSSDNQRWNLLNLHILMIKDAPVFGIGYPKYLSHTSEDVWRKYGFEFNENQHLNSHAHNQFLNITATTGLIGLIPFVLFYFWFLITNFKLVKFFKTTKQTEHYILAIACLMTQIEFLIANLTDIGFEYAKIRSLILLVWALVFCLWQNRIKISQATPE